MEFSAPWVLNTVSGPQLLLHRISILVYVEDDRVHYLYIIWWQLFEGRGRETVNYWKRECWQVLSALVVIKRDSHWHLYSISTHTVSCLLFCWWLTSQAQYILPHLSTKCLFHLSFSFTRRLTWQVSWKGLSWTVSMKETWVSGCQSSEYTTMSNRFSSSTRLMMGITWGTGVQSGLIKARDTHNRVGRQIYRQVLR